MTIAGDNENIPSAAIFGEIPTMIYDGLRCSWRLKIAGKWPVSSPVSSHRVAGPNDVRVRGGGSIYQDV